jgi:hypothetical protein
LCVFEHVEIGFFLVWLYNARWLFFLPIGDWTVRGMRLEERMYGLLVVVFVGMDGPWFWQLWSVIVKMAVFTWLYTMLLRINLFLVFCVSRGCALLPFILSIVFCVLCRASNNRHVFFDGCSVLENILSGRPLRWKLTNTLLLCSFLENTVLAWVRTVED